MPSGSHPASPSKRRSRSPAPRFEPEPAPEVVEEAPVEAPAPAEAIVHDVVQESIDEAARREALYRKDAPALVAASLLQDMWASLHLHQAPPTPSFGAPALVTTLAIVAGSAKPWTTRSRPLLLTAARLACSVPITRALPSMATPA